MTRFFLIFIIVFASCQSQDNTEELTEESHPRIEQLFQQTLEIEWAYRNKDFPNVQIIAQQLAELLVEIPFSQDSSLQDHKIAVQSILEEISNQEQSLDPNDLHLLLQNYQEELALLSSHVDADPYIFYLLDFQENLDQVTLVGVDPMLDLLEWGEFELLINCMNNSWNSLRLHRPSPALFDYEKSWYHSQNVQKANLEEKLAEFNRTAVSDDWINDNLCNSSRALAQSYQDYLKSFINPSSFEPKHLLL